MKNKKYPVNQQIIWILVLQFLALKACPDGWADGGVIY